MRVLNQRYSAFDYYLYTSFIVATALWFGKYIADGQAVFDNFFLCFFLVGSYTYFANGIGNSEFLKRPSVASSIFSFQIVSLIGMSFIEQISGGVYLTVVPIAMAYYVHMQGSGAEGKGLFHRGLAFIAILPLTIIIGESLTHRELITGQSGVYLFAFMFWSLATLITSQDQTAKKSLSLIDSLRKVSNGNVHPIGANRAQKDRLFFHDLINQTHGINLYLSSRISKGEGLDPSECHSLINEIRVIQTLIKDHFQLRHKNLTQNYDYVTFDYAKSGVEQLVHSFLPEFVVKCHFEYLGDISSNATLLQREASMIHYPAFTRILTNLVKNISEVKAEEVFLTFDYNDEGLKIVVKNKILNQDNSIVELEKKLSQLILHENVHEVIQRESGLGLESVTRLCREHGGAFKFYLEHDFWVNEVTLPRPGVEEVKAA